VIGETVLVTGFPSYAAARMARKILGADCSARIILLTPSEDRAAIYAERLPESERRRVRILVGDVCAMDLGLAGAELGELAAEVTTIHHMAGVDGERGAASRVNVQGTRGSRRPARRRRACPAR